MSLGVLYSAFHTLLSHSSSSCISTSFQIREISKPKWDRVPLLKPNPSTQWPSMQLKPKLLPWPPKSDLCCLLDVISYSFSCTVMSNSLQPHRLQHTRFPCPSPSPGVCSNSCPSSQWCHPTISSSVIPLLLLPSVFPSIRVFSSESALCFRWPKYWSFNISLSNEYSRLISFRIDWFDLLAVQRTLKSLFQCRSSNGFSRQECWSGLPFPSPMDHILSELSTMTHPSWVALHSIAHSFIKLEQGCDPCHCLPLPILSSAIATHSPTGCSPNMPRPFLLWGLYMYFLCP